MVTSTNSNNYNQQKERGLKRKLEAIISKGGKCLKCGYNKNIAALDFHHIEPELKSHELDVRHFSNTSIDNLELELAKCILLCANCHREEHNPNMSLDIVLDRITTNTKTSFENRSGQICPICNTRFKTVTGKIYCSTQCRESVKRYPTLQEINNLYSLLKSWDKVAEQLNTTRRVTQSIRRRGF
jgi:hypothetical protein